MNSPQNPFDIRDTSVQGDVSTFSTFSGSDIKAAFGNLEIGNLQGLSVSVNREVRPVFVMGDENAVSFSRGKRGIAGSIILSTFDRHAMAEVLDKARVYTKTGRVTGNSDDSDRVGDIPATGLNSTTLTNLRDNAPGDFADDAKDKPRYSDELPPFIITLVARNSFGRAAKMTIKGVVLISEGTGVSVDDATQEAQLTFVAKEVIWWRRLQAQG